MGQTTVFTARRIVTMDADVPEATAGAVCDGRILAVGAAAADTVTSHSRRGRSHGHGHESPADCQ